MSKIPEGATHQCPDRYAASTGGIQYYRFEEGRWFYWPENVEPKGVWAECKRPCKPVTPITPTWNGPEDGLPPVGLEVEVLWNLHPREYVSCKVLAHDEGRAVFRFTSGKRKGEYQSDLLYFSAGNKTPNFRPIRTAEQLAAEAHRAKYMPQLVKLWDADTGRTEFLEAVYAMITEAGKP